MCAFAPGGGVLLSFGAFEYHCEVGQPVAPLLHQPVCWISTLHDTEDLAEELGRGRLGGMALDGRTGLTDLVCTGLEAAEV